MNYIIKGDYQVLSNKQIDTLKQLVNQDIGRLFFDANDIQKIFLKDSFNHSINYYDGLIEGKEIIINQDKDITLGIVDDLNSSVIGLMIKHNIYRKEIALNLLKESRIKHVLSMTELSIELAKIHHVDIDKAQIAGLFHDGTKKWSYEENIIYMEKYHIDRLNDPKPVLHQFTGAYYLYHELGYQDQDVFDAIYHHAYGDDDKPLSMIIYLADKLDPSRGYDSSELINLAKKDLPEAVRQEKIEQLDYLKNHPSD